MALFKIEKGLSGNLMMNRPYANEGYAYFTTDDGKFYIDIAGDGQTTDAVIGINRIPLSADAADRLLKEISFYNNTTNEFFDFDGTEDLMIDLFGLAGQGNHSEIFNSVNNQAFGDYSHVEGFSNKADGNYSHAEGYSNEALGIGSHAEGYDTSASAEASHAEGLNTTAEGLRSHAEGNVTVASGDNSHAEGDQVQAIGDGSHAEGKITTASGEGSHAEGINSSAEEAAAHAEGNNTTASGIYSHTEGNTTVASGTAAHAEGQGTLASGNISHAEGLSAGAYGNFSHAEGNGTSANAEGAHAEGHGTVAEVPYQHVEGQYNLIDYESKYLSIVGNGTATERSNAFAVTYDGDIEVKRDIDAGGKTSTTAIFFKTEDVPEGKGNFGGGKTPIYFQQGVPVVGSPVYVFFEEITETVDDSLVKNLVMTDTVTGKFYRLGVDNELLYIEEVPTVPQNATTSILIQDDTTSDIYTVGVSNGDLFMDNDTGTVEKFLILTDDTTNYKYRLGANNGLLYIDKQAKSASDDDENLDGKKVQLQDREGNNIFPIGIGGDGDLHAVDPEVFVPVTGVYTNNAVVRFDGTLGNIKNSNVLIENDDMIVPGQVSAGSISTTNGTSATVISTTATGAKIAKTTNAVETSSLTVVDGGLEYKNNVASKDFVFALNDKVDISYTSADSCLTFSFK